MNKVLMVVAHPDDEIIFGYPIFQDKSIKKKLLCCSSDLNNPGRQWCKERRIVLEDLCRLTDTELVCLDYNSSFYHSRSRRPDGVPRTPEGDAQGPLRSICDDISKHIQDMSKDVDYVFTHNPYGEYGHMDHKLCFDMVLKNTDKDILITDIHLPSNWSQHYTFSKKMKDLYYHTLVKANIEIDEYLYQRAEQMYRSANSWTRGRETVKKCNLFKI